MLMCSTGCEDGCVRNSDCAEGFTCSDAICAIKVTDSGFDATLDATNDQDAGE